MFTDVNQPLIFKFLRQVPACQEFAESTDVEIIALPILLETAKRFVIEITDESNVNTIVQDVRSKFDEFTLGNISHFELAKQDHT